MSTLLNLNGSRVLDKLGAAIPALPSKASPRCKQINLGKNLRSLGQSIRLLQSLLDDFAEEPLLPSHRFLLGVQDFLLLLTQFIRVEPLGIGHGLLSHVSLRHQMQVGLGNLDEITECTVVLDLQV